MFGSGNDIILHSLAKLDKIGAVASYPYNEILIILGFFLSGKHGFFVYNIKLNMLSSKAELGFYK